jgi:hypothetical protein
MGEFRLRLTTVAAIAVAGVVGMLAGGWLDYNAAGDMDALRAVVVRSFALLLAVGAGLAGLRQRHELLNRVAVGSAAFLVGSLVGGWIAPSMEAAGQSAGSARVDLRGPESRSDILEVGCHTESDGTSFGFESVSTIGGSGTTTVRLALSLTTGVEFSGAPVPANAFRLELGIGDRETGAQYGSTAQGDATTLAAKGTFESGRVEFDNLPRTSQNGEVSHPELPTMAGVIEWTCQPALAAPGPKAGTWFH